jgi:hypothetical protein
MEPPDDFPLALLPSLALEAVFEAYVATAMPTNQSRRRKREWLASHRSLYDIEEFCRVAKRAHAAVEIRSAWVAGVRVNEWEGFEGALGIARGSMTVIVGAPHPSGKSVAARFFSHKIAREINDMQGNNPDAASPDAHLIDRIERAHSADEIIWMLDQPRSASLWSACMDDTKALFRPTPPQSPENIGPHFMMCGALLRQGGVHTVVVVGSGYAYDPPCVSKTANRIVVITGSGANVHARTADAAAPLLSMGRHRLIALFGSLPPYTALVFDREQGSIAGRHQFEPSTTRISAVTDLTGQGAWPTVHAD